LSKNVESDSAGTSVREQLERVLASRYFLGAEGRGRFLRFIVEQTLADRAAELKEYVIGVEVFGRGEAFNPKADSIVRVEARKLRAKLEEYYQNEGRADPLRIEIPKGGYAPVFRPQRQDPAIATRRRLCYSRRITLGVGAVGGLCLVVALVYRAFLPHLPPAQDPGRTQPDVKAHLIYIKGRQQLSQRTLPGVMAAIDSFEDATHQDPKFAAAYSGLADALELLGSYGIYPPKDVFPRAKTAALQALQLDPGLAEAHASLAAIQGGYEWHWPEAEAEFRRAVALKPAYATAHQWYAEYLTALGRHPEAIHEAELAQSLDPHSPTVISVLGLTLYFAHQSDRAIAQYKRALEFNPNHILTYFFLGYADEQKGTIAEAITDFQMGIALAKGAGTAHLGHVLAVAGRRSEAHAIIDQLKAQSADQYVSPLDIAIVYVGLGDRESAFTWLDRAYEDHSQWLEHLKVDPRYDPIRDDRRFSGLLRKLNME